jgi:hypothetical protein
MASPSQKNTNPDFDHRRNGAVIVNPADAPGDRWSRSTLFLMWFGATGTKLLYVWADSFEDAFEYAADWLGENGKCGFFTTISDDDLRAAAREELGDSREYDTIEQILAEIKSGDMGRIANKVLDRAEADLTMIGHTSYPECEKKLGGGPLYIPSWEWGGDEVVGNERKEVLEASIKEADED